MRWFRFRNRDHHDGSQVEDRLRVITKQLDLIIRTMETTMATKEQLDKLRTDVAALITEAVQDITAAVAAAQSASPDPAIDQLDTDVTTATQTLKDAAAKLANPPATP